VPDVVSDTSPLQYLHQLDLLDVLPAFYRVVVVPAAVAAELDEGRVAGVSLPDVRTLSWARVAAGIDDPVVRLLVDLGSGEREALALAVARPGSLVLLDDLLARRYARVLGLRFTGTLGILLRAKREGRVPSVARLVDRLEELRFRLDARTRRGVLRKTGEDRSPP
jgi:predicted nucleic acid-binding protein